MNNQIDWRKLPPQPQKKGKGSIHYSKEFCRFEQYLKEKGWHTSIRELQAQYSMLSVK